MDRMRLALLANIVALCANAPLRAQNLSYDPPAGGWTYTYTGDQGLPGSGGFTALDGTWSHDNGSDEWDGSIIGMGRPGGVTAGLEDQTDGTVYVRLQETGNPASHGFPDPGSNRKLYFGHDIMAEGATDTIIDDGVTLSFRARVATGGVLDPQHPDGGGTISPWPDGGVGYNLHNGSKSIFTIKQAAGGSVSFSLALPSSEGSPSPGLVTNNLNGNAVTGAVDGFGSGGQPNFLAFKDATDWHEYWVTIQAGGSGTHQVQLWRDGTAVATTFDVTAGNGSDFSVSYLALGLGATPRQGAVDVDFFSWAPGVIAPANAVTPAPGDFNLDSVVNVDDYLILSANLNLQLEQDVFFEDGDFDGDGDVDLDDFGQLKAIAPGAVAAAQGVPEPSSLALAVLLLGACFAPAVRRIRSKGTATLLFAGVIGMLTQAATAQNVIWIGQTGSYTESSNWDTGFPPDSTFGESGFINNGGTAQLSEDAGFGPDDLTLGQNAGDSGTLEIQNGGNLTIADVFLVGGDGEGHLIMRPGSSLTVMDDMGNAGAAASSILLGEAGAAELVTIDVTDNLEFHRNLRVVGPNVQATAADVILGNDGTYTAEVTGPVHSTLVGTGTVALGGTLHLEFNGIDPTTANSWVLADGGSISGSFSAVTSNVDPGPGFGFFVTTGAGGDQGQVATLRLESRLQLSIDPETGVASIDNLTDTESFDIDGYAITSTAGNLTPANWTSIAGGDAAWVESDTSSVRLGETNFTGSTLIGPKSSVALGAILAPPGNQGMLDDLAFLYHVAGGGTLTGLKALVEAMPPDGIPGDYNGNGTVEQADLDLVLLNWGQPGIPNGWVNDLPEGNIDQAELDGVLLNWGNMAAQGLAASPVPEPAAWIMILIACAFVAIARKLA